MLISIKKNYPYLLFFISLYYSKELLFLFFDSTQSADFNKYFVYFEYFFQMSSETGREHGTFFYYVHSLSLSRFVENVNQSNFFYLLNRSIQEVNFYIYVFGLIGYYLLLRFFTFKKETIFLTFACLNFFPLAIALRITFKPEILAFALVPWILFCFEKFNFTKDIKYLFFSIPFVVLCITSKGSVLGMVGLFLFIHYLKFIFKIQLKTLGLLLLALIIPLVLISHQDYKVNNSNILEVNHSENYRNNASYKIIYNLDFPKLFKSPIKYDHSNSFIALTLLDTFGDYFGVYWNNDSSMFFKNRKEVLINEQSNSLIFPKIDIEDIQIKVNSKQLTNIYPRESLGLLLSLAFFTYMLHLIIKKNKYRKFIYSPIFGIAILLVQSVLGFPKQNWDPLVGDSIKPFYYGFFLTLSFVFIFIDLLSKKYIKFLAVVFFIIVNLYILGFPKFYDPIFIDKLLVVNSYSQLCEVNTLFFNILENISANCNFINLNNQNLNYSNYLSFKSFEYFMPMNIGILLAALSSSLFLILKNKDLISLRK